MIQETEAKTTRRPYSKPQLEQVRLVAEEAVLLNCKSSQGSGPAGSPPIGRCNKPEPGCFTAGS
jgi:hypothetical protein